ncbi:hypothetical protein [Novosphingobium sp. JCM 18896]|uniref:hypothetical protein n=1 Tax=Novosphingobium sp. JCM 18896 TaxID=2989731 RepID=UPI0022227256|nr:hypothetical protein [Novosphingobium sp. JCM 18896]MCW1429064.1 hypothetical protein [Novosphingobium sp. JCM 18896]
MTALALSLPLLLAQPASAAVANEAPAEPAPDAAAAPAPDAVPAAAEATAAEPNIIAPPGIDPAPVDVDSGKIEGRRRPGQDPRLPDRITQENAGALRAPPPEAFPADQVPIPDRWRLIQSLGVVKERWFDPYHQNTYKGDRPIDREKVKWLPIKGEDWFFVANLISDTVVEPRTFPIPVGIQYPERPGSNDVFGKDSSLVLSQTFIGGVALIKGQTAYKPPDIEYRVTLAYNMNYVRVPERRILYVEPSRGRTRFDDFLGVQEAFIDYHLHNSSDRYDFHSIRVGIQQFQADFRGFLFNDNQLGIRLFGNRDNNRFQYNLSAWWRLEKDTNSGLNDVTQGLRKDWIFHANLYRQDFPFVGLTSELSATVNINREGGDVEIDDNGFPVRPALIGNLKGRDYDVAYIGYGVDGRLGRLNLTAFGYAALGEDRNNVFTGRPAEIRAWFGAAELSYDKDWMRFRLSGLFASGDDDPFDDTEKGFDAIFENPVFAGADTSYWIRQSVPFIGGGRAISLNGRNGILNSLRSSKDQGQSNFINPGTMLLGAGGDFDITPQLRISANANHLWFENTKVLSTLRSEGSIPKAIGWDLSAAAVWRPKATQNLVFRLSAATLRPGGGFRDLFTNFDRNRAYYSVLANVILSY